MTDLRLPQNETEAREVLEVSIRQIIINNYTEKPNGGKLLNATKASQEITNLLIEAYKKLKESK